MNILDTQIKDLLSKEVKVRFKKADRIGIIEGIAPRKSKSAGEPYLAVYVASPVNENWGDKLTHMAYIRLKDVDKHLLDA